MVPFKSIFTGDIPVPTNPRATSCQTCLRAGGKHNDLENVGHTARHHTFFEMLGNFSFGDYFKEDAIAYAWEFVTEVLKFDVNKLWVTVHDSDDEAYELWQKHITVDRIMRLGDKDNFWQMGDTGPCGPSSEIFFDQGEENFNGPEDYLGGDGDRFLEIWNLVFMQYNRDSNGVDTPLPKPSIDTGMGLERVVAISEGKLSNYDSSLFMPIINEVEKLVGKTYAYKTGASYRVIADHIRTAVFLIAQGVHFDKEGRGYVMRRIVRRAIRHGYLLGLTEPFMHKLVKTVVELMGHHYSYLREKQVIVEEEIRLEEERFFKTISSGIDLFNEALATTKEQFSGEVAFKLYDTYGFPLDLTEDMLREKELSLDTATFDRLMQEQRDRAKAAWKGSGDAKNDGDFKAILEQHGTNTFVGYEHLEATSTVKALLNSEFKQVDRLDMNEEGWVMLEPTPFYAKSGGQAGDQGLLKGVAEVIDTDKFFDLNLSQLTTSSAITVGDSVKAIVDAKRFETTKHHSATHLLHAGLRTILGDHVTQAGSLVEFNRLRFDFSHPKAVDAKTVSAIEKWVNDRVLRGIVQETEETSIERAKEKGALALFGEKYGDEVRVVSFDQESVELCGGTHVKDTSAIGTFVITKESGVSAGVRRIEALCGQAATEYLLAKRDLVNEVSDKVKNSDVNLGIAKLQAQIKELKSEVIVAQNASKKELDVLKVGDTAVIVDKMDNGDIKTRVDELKNEHTSVAVMLFQEKGGKVLLAAGVKEASIKAGAWIKAIAPIVGGGGGGRDDFAQAGGKDASKIDEALRVAVEFAKENI
jgi:alanyl-tRNA synthetase